MGEEAKGWMHWSTNEKVAAVILLSVLAIFVILFGPILYEPPTGPGLCGSFGATPCPGREDLYIVRAAVSSATSMTVQITNTGCAAIFLGHLTMTRIPTASLTRTTAGHALQPRPVTPQLLICF